MHQDLSPREREVVRLVAQGKTNREVALEAGLAPSTVKDYMANACRKAGVTNRVALTAWWTSKEAGASTTPAGWGWPKRGIADSRQA